MNKLVTILIAGSVLGASGLGAQWLVAARDQPEKKQRVQRGVAVETVAVRRAKHRLDVRASGVVVPARDLDVFPQVNGRVEWLYEDLMPGTFVKAGQTLFRIDASNYRLSIDQQQAEVKRAESALELERGRQKIAESELSILQQNARGEEGELDNALVLREPQFEAAQGDLAAAKARLKSARLDLSRTSFAPRFDVVIVESNAEIGQLATPQTRLARVVGTEKFWVRVPLEKEKLPHVSIAGIGDDEGSTVTVRQEVGSHVIEREGKVVRLLSNLEPGSRMARVLVEIDDPYGLEVESEKGARPYPILLDAYVDVVIHGDAERELIEVPRKALHQGDTVHVYDDDVLDIRTVSVAWRLPGSVLVERGLDDGDRVIVSPLAAPVPKMKLRDVTEQQKSAK